MKRSLRQAPDRVELHERLAGLDFCIDIRLPGVLTCLPVIPEACILNGVIRFGVR